MENQSINLGEYKCVKYGLVEEDRPRYAKGFYINKNHIIMVGEFKKKSGEYIEVNTIRLKYKLTEISNLTIMY